MKSNPAQIEPGTIFLCGNMSDPDSEKQFAAFARQLEHIGRNYVTPYEIPPWNLTGDKRQALTISFLAMCDLVVTINGWEKSQNAVNQVNIARLMKKEVIISEVFYHELHKSNNKASNL